MGAQGQLAAQIIFGALAGGSFTTDPTTLTIRASPSRRTHPLTYPTSLHVAGNLHYVENGPGFCCSARDSRRRQALVEHVARRGKEADQRRVECHHWADSGTNHAHSSQLVAAGNRAAYPASPLRPRRGSSHCAGIASLDPPPSDPPAHHPSSRLKLNIAGHPFVSRSRGSCSSRSWDAA